MTLAELRAAVVAAVADVGPVGQQLEVAILEAPADALEPPALVIQWGPDPWRTIASVCTDDANLELLAVAPRLTPDATYAILEELVDATTAALVSARLRPYQTLAPGPLEVAGIAYLAARIQIRRPVETGGNP